MNLAIYLSAFLLGLGGSLHCLGMCGPLVMAVPYPGKKNKTLKMITYLTGKALAYASLGLIMGILGAGLYLLNWQQAVSIVSGLLIILITIFPLLKPSLGRFPLKNTMVKLLKNLKENPKWYYYVGLGFLNGLLPCGMVYVALTTAIVAGNPLSGALAMFLFGVGTMPILLAVKLFKSRIQGQKLKYVTITISIFVGLLLVLRGMNLGIPYVSPHFDQEKQEVRCAQ